MGTVAWQPAPNPPRLVYSPAYRIDWQRSSTVGTATPTKLWNVNEPVIVERAMIQLEHRVAIHCNASHIHFGPSIKPSRLESRHRILPSLAFSQTVGSNSATDAHP